MADVTTATAARILALVAETHRENAAARARYARERINAMHPLVRLILDERTAVRAEHHELTVIGPRRRGVPVRRARLRDRSLILSGLEQAATLALGPADVRILMDELRQSPPSPLIG